MEWLCHYESILINGIVEIVYSMEWLCHYEGILINGSVPLKNFTPP